MAYDMCDGSYQSMVMCDIACINKPGGIGYVYSDGYTPSLPNYECVRGITGMEVIDGTRTNATASDGTTSSVTAGIWTMAATGGTIHLYGETNNPSSIDGVICWSPDDDTGPLATSWTSTYMCQRPLTVIIPLQYHCISHWHHLLPSHKHMPLL